ncbi:hypothetical protein [Microvirga sp. Mcv34]|uniref:hypothetical protein n=1 Tax=Microvirga sp. Mcv34 TaxID=2926016 RepID=UPI0021C84E80|nr:hypothetical protein [Microvirga sp. Mcv34]
MHWAKSSLLEQGPIVLMSIRPQYVRKILEGTKTVELRRKFSQNFQSGVLLIYATAPVMAVVGAARIVLAKDMPITQIWRMHRKESGVCKTEFDAYFHNVERGYVLSLSQVMPLENCVTRGEMYERYGLVPPQSYRILDAHIARDILNANRANSD